MSIVPSYTAAALVYSIVGLSAVAPVTFFFRHTFRGLEFMQMAYYFALVMGGGSFSGQLGTSLANFNYNFLTFCSAGDLVCSLGFQLSFASCLAGVLIFFWLVVMVQKCCRPHLRYQPLYLMFKGFIKWVYIPIAVPATKQLLTQILQLQSTTRLIQAAAILGFLALFPFLQLIGYKCIQEEETPIWEKWLQFFSYLRALSVSVLLGLSNYYNDTYYCHFIMIPLLLYGFIYMWKGVFKYPVMERVIFIFGEAIFIALYYLFKYANEYVSKYDIDFFVIGVVLLIDLLLYLVRACKLGCYGVSESAGEVNPQKMEVQPMSSPRGRERKPNKYEHDSGEELQQSRESLSINNNKSFIKKRR